MHPKQCKCAYCLKKLPSPFIACAECENVRLCVNCFLSGAEAGRHKNTHAYTVKSLRQGPPLSIFGNPCDWTFSEENKLLNALETYGYGNWYEVAVQLGTRSAAECQSHYDQFYVNGVIGKFTHKNDNGKRGFVCDHTLTDADEFFNSSSILRPDEQKLLGYMPYRDEFEYEYCNNAERTLVSVSLGPTDELENELRLALVSIYNGYLEKRRLLHKIAREHDLVPLLFRAVVRPSTKLKRSSRRFGGRVYRRRRVGFSVSRGRRDYFGMRNAGRHQRVSRLKAIPEALEHFSSASHFDQSLQTTHDYSKHVKRNDRFQIFTPDSGLSNPMCVNESCSEPVKSVQPILAVGSGSEHADFVGTASAASCKLNSTAMCCTRLGGCTRATLNGTSDSGLGSCDSCTQSEVSTKDSYTCLSSNSNSAANLSEGRTRCDSDSLSHSSSNHTAIKMSPELLMNVTDQGLHTENSLSVNQTIEGSSCKNEENQLGFTNSAVLLNGLESKAIVECRNRLPRVGLRKIRPVSRSKYFNVIKNTHPTWLKPFVRYMTCQEATKILTNLERESILRSEINSLMDYHRKGVRLMSHVELPSSTQFNSTAARVSNGNAIRMRGTNKRLAGRTMSIRSSRTSCRTAKYGRHPAKRVSKSQSRTPRRSQSKTTIEVTSVRKRGRPSKRSLQHLRNKSLKVNGS